MLEPGPHPSSRRPTIKGRRFPADPPRVEEIIAVMRTAGDRPYGFRLRALIVILWRSGLRISEALALAETDQEAGILELVEGTVDLVPGVRLLPAPGHTPGQFAIEIGHQPGALYLADVVADELHVQHPDWVMAFDQEPELNVETRNALLERAIDEGRIVAAAHIGKPGRIERVQNGFRFVSLRAGP